MTKTECEKCYGKIEALRKIAGECFGIIKTTVYKSSKEEDSWSISAHLYGWRHLYSVEDCKKYFEKAKTFFLNALDGEPKAVEIEKLEF